MTNRFCMENQNFYFSTENEGSTDYLVSSNKIFKNLKEFYFKIFFHMQIEMNFNQRVN